MGRPLFPLVIRLGQTKATIYLTPIHGRPQYTLCWYEGTARKRRVFAELEEAKREGKLRVDALARGEAQILQLTGVERLEYIRAREALKGLSISLDSAAKEYQEARQILNGVSLLTAARSYAATHRTDLPQRTVAQLVDEMLVAKRQEGLSDRYLKDLECRLGDFADAFRCPIQSLSGSVIRTWLQEKKIANRTRNNFRLTIQTLVSFAKARRYLPPEWNELEAVPVWKAAPGELQIFTPQEMTRLLKLADSKLRPFLVIGGFAGLRTAEIERLDWADIDLAGGYIRVSAAKSKTGSRRLVPIADNLRAWLTPIARKSGPVVELANIPNGIQRLVESTKPSAGEGTRGSQVEPLEWKHNALRHSFCSYRLAILKNAAQLALEAGNSPAMIFQHYRELVTEAEAIRWFSLVPPS